MRRRGNPMQLSGPKPRPDARHPYRRAGVTGASLPRRSLLAAGLALLGPNAAAQEPPADVTYVQDFDELWRTLDEHYCYFSDKTTDWQLVRSRFRPLALAATDDAGLTEILRRVLAELYDPHTHLSDPPDGSPAGRSTIFWPWQRASMPGLPP